MKSKEDILNLMKSSVLTIRDRQGELFIDGKLKEKWRNELSIINDSVDVLPAEDIAWLNSKYKTWAEENLKNPLDLLMSKGSHSQNDPEENT